MTTLSISFMLYTLGIAALGIYSRRFAKKSTADFLLADRGLGAWVAALSASASAESGWVTLGLVGFAFHTGIAAFWIVPGTVAAFWFNWFVLAPRLHQLSVASDSLTLPELLASRFRGLSARLIRLAGVLIILSMLTAYVAAQLNAAGKTFSGTFGWDYSSGVLIGAIIVLAYTVTGGFRAIAWTDVVQASFMIAAVTLVPFLLIAEVGGFGPFWSRLTALEGGRMVDPVAGTSGWALIAFLSLWLGIPLGYPGQPHVLLRLMAVKDRRTILRGGIISTIWVAVLFSGAILVGLAGRIYFVQLPDPEKILPLVAADASLIPGVIGGMLIAAIMAAIASTADSQLLVSASAISHDLLVGLFGVRLSLARKLLCDRAAVLLVGGLATLIAMAEVRTVFTFVLDYGWAGLGAGFGPPLVLALLWRRTSGPGVLCGMLAGVLTAVIWRQLPALNDLLYNLVPAFIISLTVTWAVSLVSRQKGGDSS